MGIITSMFAGQSAKISDRHTTDEALEAAKGGSGAKGNRGLREAEGAEVDPKV